MCCFWIITPACCYCKQARLPASQYSWPEELWEGCIHCRRCLCIPYLKDGNVRVLWWCCGLLKADWCLMRWTCTAQTMEEAIRNDTAAQTTFLKTFGRRPRFDWGAKKKQSHIHRPTCSEFCTGMYFKKQWILRAAITAQTPAPIPFSAVVNIKHLRKCIKTEYKNSHIFSRILSRPLLICD